MAHNLVQAQSLVRQAHEAGAKALFLPEAADYIAPNAAASFSICKPLEESEFVLGLQKAAQNYALPINVGIHEPAKGSKVKNTLLWIDENGDITQRYQKLHLFDVDIENGPQLRESASVERGMEILGPVTTPLGRVGLQICFDLRFPEPALTLRSRNAQIITYPSAFTVPTGRAGHWEVLLRARAIETQSYVIAAAQVGVHDEEAKRRSYGHSMIVDPWGKVLAELRGEDDCDDGGNGLDVGSIAVAEIDLEYLDKIRREVPLIRRTDIYPELA